MSTIKHFIIHTIEVHNKIVAKVLSITGLGGNTNPGRALHKWLKLEPTVELYAEGESVLASNIGTYKLTFVTEDKDFNIEAVKEKISKVKW